MTAPQPRQIWADRTDPRRHVTVTDTGGGWVTGRLWREGSWRRSKPLCMAYAQFTACYAYVRDLGDCPTCTGPIRETTDMVCPTCGTDRVAKLERERDEARAHVLRVESQRMDWQLIHDRLDALVDELRRLGHPVTGELTGPAAAATTGGETTAINGYFCAAILDHDHPCPTMCAAPVAQQGQRCSPHHAQPSYRPCPSCPEYARNAWAGTATTGGEAGQ